MRLAATMLVRNELGRWLLPAVTHALTYCDELIILDEASTDGTYEWLLEQDRVQVHRRAGPGWSEEGGHEGRARQALLNLALHHSGATHIIALDADEVIPH